MNGSIQTQAPPLDMAALKAAAFELGPDPALVVDAEGALVAANEAAEALFGQGLGLLARGRFRAALPPGSALVSLLNRALEEGARVRERGVQINLFGLPPFEADGAAAPLGDGSVLLTLSVRAGLGVERAFVTLHVGAGTFQPVRVENLDDHVMHAEWYTVGQPVVDAIARARARGGRVIAVGTTSVRALESAAAQNPAGPDAPLAPAQGDTRLFITPGYRYRVIDALVTNFHLPQSTLLMLVSALAGIDPIRRAYAHAVARRYRFFSYGDAMFIESPAS